MKFCYVILVSVCISIHICVGSRDTFHVIRKSNHWVQCQANCEKFCEPKIHILNETVNNCARNYGRVIHVKKSCMLAVVCYAEFDHNQGYIIRMIESRIRREEQVSHGLSIVYPKKSLVVTILRDYKTNPGSLLHPKISTNMWPHDGDLMVTIECSNEFPVEQMQTLELIRIFHNGTRKQINFDPQRLFLNFNLDHNKSVNMAYEHKFIYNETYLNNTFECKTTDTYYQIFKSVISTPLHLKLTTTGKKKKMDKPKDRLQKGDSIWSPWSPWSGCSLSCGRGIKKRRRICLRNGEEFLYGCPGQFTENEECYLMACPTSEIKTLPQVCSKSVSNTNITYDIEEMEAMLRFHLPSIGSANFLNYDGGVRFRPLPMYFHVFKDDQNNTALLRDVIWRRIARGHENRSVIFSERIIFPKELNSQHVFMTLSKIEGNEIRFNLNALDVSKSLKIFMKINIESAFSPALEIMLHKCELKKGSGLVFCNPGLEFSNAFFFFFEEMPFIRVRFYPDD